MESHAIRTVKGFLTPDRCRSCRHHYTLPPCDYIPKSSAASQKGLSHRRLQSLPLSTEVYPFFFTRISNKYADLTNTRGVLSLSKFSLLSRRRALVRWRRASTSYWSVSHVAHPQLPGVSCGIAVATTNLVFTGAGEGRSVATLD